METKHTPGEWISEIQNGVRFGSFDSVSKSDGSATIAIVYGQDDDERRANTKLIAAAPDLLDALLSITSNPHIYLSDLVYDVREMEGQGWDGPHVKQWQEAVEKVKTVLKKIGYDQPI